MMSDIDTEKLELQKTVVRLRQELADRDSKIQRMHQAISGIADLVKSVVKKEEEILSSKKELELIFNASSDCVAVLDKNHKIRRVNKALCDLLGIDSKQLVGVDFYGLFDDLPVEFDKLKIQSTKFLETTYFSKRFNKWLIMKSMMLKQEFEPLVYIHITKDVSNSL